MSFPFPIDGVFGTSSLSHTPLSPASSIPDISMPVFSLMASVMLILLKGGLRLMSLFPYIISVFQWGFNAAFFTISSVLLIDNRKRPDRFTKKCKFIHMNSCFAHLGFKNMTFHADNITDIKKMFKNSIIHSFIFPGADIITTKIDLDSS